MSPGARRALVLAAAAAALLGCAPPPPALKPAPAAPLTLPPEVAAEQVVPGAGACAPPGHPDTAFVACCGGQACRGYCVLRRGAAPDPGAAPLRPGCRCFEQAGGCGPGLICCKEEGRCVTPEACFERKALEP